MCGASPIVSQRRIVPYLVLFGGVIIVSSAPVFIRFAQHEGMPPLVIAAGRLTIAALVLTPIAVWRVGDELRTVATRDRMLGIVAGLFLALHFATWITSLEYTSVASSSVLVTTNPLWVGLASFFWFGERLGWKTIVALVLTLLGSVVITLSDNQSSPFPNPLFGNILALFGALSVSGYFLVGRSIRRRVSILAYIWLAYSSAAVLLVLVALLAGQPLFGHPLIAYAAVGAMALGPQLLGHTAFNWALRYLSATFITIAILGEPVISAILARLIFNEHFTSVTIATITLPLQLIGFVIILFGIALAAFDEPAPPPHPNP